MPDETSRENTAIREVRVFFYEVCKSFFLEEPDDEKIGHWRQIMTSLAREAPSLELADAARRLVLVMDEQELKAIREEYYSLFVDPFSEKLVNWTVSGALSGRNFGPRLVEIRQLMAARGLVKEEAFKEPEDSLPVLLDLMARLIEMENEVEEQATAAERQVLRDFLQPLSACLLARLDEGCGESSFYRSGAVFLAAWLKFDESCFV